MNALGDAYLKAKQFVLDSGFEAELLWQLARQYHPPTETDFLREAAWVVLSSGMSERVIRSIFPKISIAFMDWNSAEEIVAEEAYCRERAFQWFRHEGKIEAIIEIASRVAIDTFDHVAHDLKTHGIAYLQEFPYLGPATSVHLAKNLGLQIAKPDRHLKRIAERFQFSGVDGLCSTIADYVGDEISEVDLILWRYATLERNYLNHFSVAVESFSPELR